MNKTKIITDACCKIPNAHIQGRSSIGKSACGVLVIDHQGEEHESSKYLGEMTVPEAEFRGLIYALDYASSITRYEVEVWMDSELVVKWMTGQYRLRKEHIRPLFDQASILSKRFKSIDYFHHNRSTPYGKRADDLANKEYRRNQT